MSGSEMRAPNKNGCPRLPRIASALGDSRAENFYVTLPPKPWLTNYSYPAKGVYLSFEGYPDRKLAAVVKPQ